LTSHEKRLRPLFFFSLELTILIPCLNEAQTLPSCVAKAKAFIERTGIVAEVLVSDNGSTDGSQELASSLGARVVDARERGYGAALITGIQAASGRFVIMGDGDDSYDFSQLDGFVDKLRQGADLVMGNRFKGGIAPGAMPPLHRYLGNPILSWLGRTFFRVNVGDFHCGLRGFSRDAMLRLGLVSPAWSSPPRWWPRQHWQDMSSTRCPTTLSPDGRRPAPSSANLARRLAASPVHAPVYAAVAFPHTRAPDDGCAD
jgi:glycosyltransferase involved in cell wall biosynthesis